MLTPRSLATAPSQSSEMCNNPHGSRRLSAGYLPWTGRVSAQRAWAWPWSPVPLTDKVQDDSSWFMALSSGPRTRAAQKAWLGRRPGLPLWQYQALDVGDSASDLPYSAPTSLSACARHDAADDHTVHRRALQLFVERLNLAPSPILSALQSRSLLLVDQRNNPYLLHTISRRRSPTRKQIPPVSRSSASRPNAATLSAADVRSHYRDPRTSHEAAQGSQGHQELLGM